MTNGLRRSEKSEFVEQHKKYCLNGSSLLSSYNKGESIKPGNVKLNIRRLIESLPDLTEAVVGIAMDITILKVCAALNF